MTLYFFFRSTRTSRWRSATSTHRWANRFAKLTSDAAFFADDRVDQGRLAGVGPSREGDRQPPPGDRPGVHEQEVGAAMGDLLMDVVADEIGCGTGRVGEADMSHLDAGVCPFMDKG